MKASPQELARLRAALREIVALAPVVTALLEAPAPPARRRVAAPDEPVTELEKAAARAELQRVRSARSRKR